jgi:PPP family 3-phenylpropionic acid transporter
MTALAVSLSPVIPLSDATTLEWLSRHGGSYGSVRVYGSFGFLVSSLIAGALLVGGRLHLLFPVYGLFLGCTFLAGLAAPRQRAAPSRAQRGSVQLVLRNRTAVVFLILVGCGFGTSAAYNTFFALYLHGLGAGTALIGVAAALASLSELPVMALSGRFIARFGVKPLLLLGLGTAAVRWLAYGLLHDVRIVLVLQLLHGLTFAASYVAGVTFMDLQVPPQLRSTGQTLFYGATFGIGTVAGANLFGALYDRVQAHGMFLAAGVICGLAVAGIALVVPNRQMTQAEALPEAS